MVFIVFKEFCRKHYLGAYLLLAVVVLLAGCVAQVSQNGGGNVSNTSANLTVKQPIIDFGEYYVKLDGITVKLYGNSSFLIWTPDIVYVDPIYVPLDPIPMDYILIPDMASCNNNSVLSMQGKYTRIFGSQECVSQLSGLTNSIKPGDVRTYTTGDNMALEFQAIAADSSSEFGYLITVGDRKIFYTGRGVPANVAAGKVDVLLLNLENAEEAMKIAEAMLPSVIVPFNYDASGLELLNSAFADKTYVLKSLSKI